MRKRFTYISTLLFILVMMAACSDWLELLPEDRQVSDAFWKSGKDVEAVLANAYGNLARQAKTLLLWGELRGGMLSPGMHVPSEAARIMQGDVTDFNSLSRWGELYVIINAANQIIEFAPQVRVYDPSFTVSEYNRTMSEALFLRALSYFYLVRTFKEVPLITAPYISDEQDYYPKKASKEALISQILQDLETALNMGVLYFNSFAETKGRATRFAIHALLADVYLWDNQYDQCVLHCSAIINSGRYSLLDSEVWFQNFYPGNSTSSIFEMQFASRWGYQSNLYQTFSFRRNREYTINPRLIEIFEPIDIRGDGATFSSRNLEIWKYVGINPDTERGDALSDNNFIVYRLADIMLLKAEAQAQLGQLTQAITLVNHIRQLRGIEPATPEPTLETVEDLILEERSRELAFEGKHWFDLLRMGKRDDYRRKEMVISALVRNATADQVLPLMVKFQNPYSWYLPIHRDETERNRNLVQNPYYQN